MCGESYCFKSYLRDELATPSRPRFVDGGGNLWVWVFDYSIIFMVTYR